MKLTSTAAERKELLKRLRNAPQTDEIISAITIVEEAIEFAELRDLIIKLYDVKGVPDTFEKIIESKWIHNEMRPFAYRIDQIRENERAQKFQAFYGLTKQKKVEVDDDGEMWQTI